MRTADCARCGNSKPSARHTYCGNCSKEVRKEHRQQNEPTAKEYALNPDNPCYRCRKAPRVTKYLCRDCQDKGNSETKAIRENRVNRGLCSQCGEHEPRPGKKMCFMCSAKSACRPHNISLERYLTMLEAGCAICGSLENLAIDHDHKCCDSRTSKCGNCVRGMLCSRHNSQVALFEHADIDLIVNYLKRTESKDV